MGSLTPAAQARLDALPPRLRAYARTSGRVHHELARHVRDGRPLGEALAHVCDHLDPMELHGLLVPDRLPDGVPPSHWIPWCARLLPCGRRCAALGVVPMQQAGGSTCWASCEDCAQQLEREGTARRR